jgi:hypothetical protein
MKLHRSTLIAFGLSIVGVAAVAATGFALSAPSSEPPAESHPPSPLLGAAEQEKLDARVRELSQRRSQARGSQRAVLEADFALFRRPARPSDGVAGSAPGQRPVELARRATAEDGTDIYLTADADEICLSASGSTGCGLVSELDTTPLSIGARRTDGTQTTTMGPADDDVVQVRATLVDGSQFTSEPHDNVYKLTVPGVIARLDLIRKGKAPISMTVHR